MGREGGREAERGMSKEEERQGRQAREGGKASSYKTRERERERDGDEKCKDGDAGQKYGGKRERGERAQRLCGPLDSICASRLLAVNNNVGKDARFKCVCVWMGCVGVCV